MIYFARIVGILLLLLAACRARRGVVVMPSGGVDFGAALTEAIASCAPGACFVDARQLTGPQHSAASIVINRSSLTVEVGFSDLTFAPGAHLEITANHVAFEGPPTATPTIRCATGVACVSIGFSGATYAVTLANLRIEPVAGTAPAAGIEMRNARGPGSFLRNLVVSGFNASGAAALRVFEDCWTWTVEDSQFANSTHGIELLGDQDNALVFQRNLITSNTREGVWIALCNHPTADAGCATGGITFSDGNHFENNGGAGIRLVSGSIYNLDVRDSYAELLQGGTGYFLAQNDGTPNQQLRVVGALLDGGGGYVSGGVPLNIFDASKGYNYGVAPIAIDGVACFGGTCTVSTQSAHGFTCSVIDNYTLCPFVHVVSGHRTYDLDTRITSIVDATHFRFSLNGTSSDNGGMVAYASDAINGMVCNQKWRSSWTAPEVVSVTGTRVTIATSNNSVVDGKGNLVGKNETARIR